MTDAQNTELMSIFDFTAEDLAANRSGQMTARQVDQAKFRLEDAQCLLGCSFFVLLPACVICTLALDAATETVNRRIGAKPLDTVWILFGLIFVVAIAILMLLGIRKLRTDIKEQVVATIDGKGNCYKEPVRYGYNYFIGTETKRFFITKPRVYTRFSDFLAHTGPEMQFRFYYAPKSDTLLAIEVLEPPT